LFIRRPDLHTILYHSLRVIEVNYISWGHVSVIRRLDLHTILYHSLRVT